MQYTSRFRLGGLLGTILAIIGILLDIYFGGFSGVQDAKIQQEQNTQIIALLDERNQIAKEELQVAKEELQVSKERNQILMENNVAFEDINDTIYQFVLGLNETTEASNRLIDEANIASDLPDSDTMQGSGNQKHH